MAVHEVALRLAVDSGRCEEAVGELRRELGEDAVEEPEAATGMFAVEAEGDTFDEAVQQVRDAIAAIGADECFEFAESSGVPLE